MAQDHKGQCQRTLWNVAKLHIPPKLHMIPKPSTLQPTVLIYRSLSSTCFNVLTPWTPGIVRYWSLPNVNPHKWAFSTNYSARLCANMQKKIHVWTFSMLKRIYTKPKNCPKGKIKWLSSDSVILKFGYFHNIPVYKELNSDFTTAFCCPRSFSVLPLTRKQADNARKQYSLEEFTLVHRCEWQWKNTVIS